MSRSTRRSAGRWYRSRWEIGAPPVASGRVVGELRCGCHVVVVETLSGDHTWAPDTDHLCFDGARFWKYVSDARRRFFASDTDEDLDRMWDAEHQFNVHLERNRRHELRRG